MVEHDFRRVRAGFWPSRLSCQASCNSPASTFCHLSSVQSYSSYIRWPYFPGDSLCSRLNVCNSQPRQASASSTGELRRTIDSLARCAPPQCQPRFCPDTICETRIQSMTKDFQTRGSSASSENYVHSCRTSHIFSRLGQVQEDARVYLPNLIGIRFYIYEMHDVDQYVFRYSTLRYM